jgi:hypothetical protein
MILKTNRAKQDGNPGLALTNSSNITRSKEAICMLANKIDLNKSAQRLGSPQKTTSPWITHRNNNVFGYEMSIVEDPICRSFSTPHPLFIWLDANKLNSVLFDVLAKLCPLHPVVSYKGYVSLWLSPPPSGSDNAVGIIIGRDKSKHLRIIGTNFMAKPTGSNRPSECVFEAFDALDGNPLAIYRLITNEIHARMTSEEVKISRIIENEAYKYRTMPIYILVIDGEKSYFGIDTAVVTGDYPSDMSYEFAGELL